MTVTLTDLIDAHLAKQAAANKPSDFHRLSNDVKCNGHLLFATLTREDAESAVQYLKALTSNNDQATIEAFCAVAKAARPCCSWLDEYEEPDGPNCPTCVNLLRCTALAALTDALRKE